LGREVKDSRRGEVKKEGKEEARVILLYTSRQRQGSVSKGFF
jgi:hypothetical protein